MNKLIKKTSRNKTLLLAIILTLVCFVKMTYAENPSELNVLKNDRGDVTLYYPKGWHIQEVKYNNPYQIFISREDTNNLTQDYKVGMTFIKIYNQSWYEVAQDYENPAAYYNKLISAAEKAPNLKTLRQDQITIAGAPALKLEQIVTSKEKVTHMITINVLKDDIEIHFILETPEEEFENYRKVFENIISSSSFFAQDADKNDNDILIHEAENLVIQEMQKQNKQGYDLKKFLEVFEEADAMSPNNATLQALFGGFLFQIAKMSDHDSKKELSQTIFQSLEQSNKLYQQFPNSFEEDIRNFYQSQNYFLMGDTYTYFLKRPENAKPYYEKSLKFFNHPEAKKELEKFNQN